MSPRDLTPKQQRFVAEYLKDLNATQAAIRAGYSATNADVTGPRLLGNVGIAAEIQKRQDKIAGKLELTAEKVLQDLEEVRAKALEGGQYAPAVRAIELRGKHIGMFVERSETTANVTVTNAVDRPERETREQWIARRAKELGIDARLLGATAGAAD
jgi:phage terminase small subunit